VRGCTGAADAGCATATRDSGTISAGTKPSVERLTSLPSRAALRYPFNCQRVIPMALRRCGDLAQAAIAFRHNRQLRFISKPPPATALDDLHPADAPRASIHHVHG